MTLVRFYHFDVLQPFQVLTASLIPVTAWIVFQYEAMARRDIRQFISHLVVPLILAICLTFATDFIDWVLVMVFLGYGIAIIFAVRGSDGTLPATKIVAGPIPTRLWYIIAILLIFMSLVDASISIMISSGHSWLSQWILSAAASCLLLVIGLVGTASAISGHHSTAALDSPDSLPVDSEVRVEDGDITSRLEDILIREQLYLDPDLTLLHVARKLGIPSKQLSASVNRHSKRNISRFINQFRIEHACTLLESGENITNAMFESGFNTKSNFNREFLRVTGKTPSKWSR